MFFRKPSAPPPARTNVRKPPPEPDGSGRPGRRGPPSPRRQLVRVALAVAIPLLFGGGALAGVYYAANRATDYLDDARGFRVEQVQVLGNERLTSDEVAALAGLAPGRSIFDLDVESARRRLLEDPWILAATVEKSMPATIRVRVVERRPQAVLAGEDGSLNLVAEDGSIFDRVSTADAPDLPVLTGFDLARRQTDPVGIHDDLVQAVELLRLVEETGLPDQRRLAELHRNERGGFDLLAHDGLLVHLGEGPYRPKLQRLFQVAAALAERGRTAAELFLPGARHPNRVTVRLAP